MRSMEEIKKRYSGEWVLIADYETDDLSRIKRGRVLAQSLPALPLRLSRQAATETRLNLSNAKLKVCLSRQRTDDGVG